MAKNKLKKSLGLYDVIATSTGAMFSSGFFLLPGIAAFSTGPSVFLAYLCASFLIVPAMLSKAELSTAMPKAGGTYFFIARSMGAAMGTIGGLGTYLALVLKTAFALIGIGAYLSLFADVDIKLIAIILSVVFAILNIFGAKETALLQRLLVGALLIILSLLIADALRLLVTERGLGYFQDQPLFTNGIGGFLSTIGLVFVSYAGLTKVSSIAEEIENPEVNIPRGMIISLVITGITYVLGVFVLVALIPAPGLYTDYTPVATVAKDVFTFLPGNLSLLLVVIAAVAAFASTGNAGILSASRYPFAMARDKLVPSFFAKLSKSKTPVISILVTVGLIIVLIAGFEIESIVKLASSFQLFIFGLVCLCVIVMRESRIDSYDPGFKSPLYPWLQIFGIIISVALIVYLGMAAILFTVGMIGLCVLWFLFYAKGKVTMDHAFLSLMERFGSGRGDRVGKRTERELRENMRAMDATQSSAVNDSIRQSAVVDLKDDESSFHIAMTKASEELKQTTGIPVSELVDGFEKSRAIGAIPVWHQVAIPHISLYAVEKSHIVLVRSKSGVEVDNIDVHGDSLDNNLVHAFVFVVSPENDPKTHLRALARIAEQVDQPNFIDKWLTAESVGDLRELVSLT